MRSVARNAWRDERVSTLIEFAILSILFLLITFGTMEYGRMIFDYNVVAHATREGARWAAVHGASAGDAAASPTAIKTYVANHSLGFIQADNVTVDWSLPNGNSGTNKPGNTVRVRAQATFQTGAPLLPVLSVDLASQTKMVIAR